MISVFLNNKDKGFTLVETIIAIALISVGVFMAMNLIDGQTKSRALRTTQTIFRYIAIQISHTATMANSFFPPISSAQNQKVVYVSCYDNKGEITRNINNLSNHQIYFPDNFKENEKSGQCTDSTSYEARFFWVNANTGELRVNILHLPSLKKKNSNRAVHNMNIFVK